MIAATFVAGAIFGIATVLLRESVRDHGWAGITLAGPSFVVALAFAIWTISEMR